MIRRGLVTAFAVWVVGFVGAYVWFLATGGAGRTTLPSGFQVLLGTGIVLMGLLIATQGSEIAVTQSSRPLVPLGYRLAGLIMIALGVLLAIAAVPRG